MLMNLIAPSTSFNNEICTLAGKILHFIEMNLLRLSMELIVDNVAFAHFPHLDLKLFEDRLSEHLELCVKA